MQHQSGAPTQVTRALKRYRQRRMRLRGTATGAHKMASIDHLHQESLTLRVKDHSDMLFCAVPCKLSGGGPCQSWHHNSRTKTHEGDSPLQTSLKCFFIDLAQAGWKATRICTHMRSIQLFNSKATTEY